MNLGLTVGDNLASRVGDVLWFSPLRIFQRLMFRTPLVYAFILGSYFYHDYCWWPFKGRPLARRFRQNDPWGQLFMQYAE